jgi:hypothetical protein
MLLVPAALAALGLATTQPGPPTGEDKVAAPKMTVADSQVRADHPPAPEEWRISVEVRSRRGPQFQWGPWRPDITYTGDYNTARRKAMDRADWLEGGSKNVKTRIREKRLR